MSICSIKALLVLDNKGRRIFSKYYDPEANLSTRSLQSSFEQQLNSKIGSMTVTPGDIEITTLDQYTAIFKIWTDLNVYLIGGPDENEMMLASLLENFCEALEILYRNEVEVKQVIDNMEYLMLAIDEMIDNGIIVTMDCNTIVERVYMKDGPLDPSQINPGRKESTFSQALANAKDQIARSFK